MNSEFKDRVLRALKASEDKQPRSTICFVDIKAQYVRDNRYDVIIRAFEIIAEKIMEADLSGDVERIAFTVTAVPKAITLEEAKP